MQCYHRECLYPREFRFLNQDEDEGRDSLRRCHFFPLDLSFSPLHRLNKVLGRLAPYFIRTCHVNVADKIVLRQWRLAWLSSILQALKSLRKDSFAALKFSMICIDWFRVFMSFGWKAFRSTFVFTVLPSPFEPVFVSVSTAPIKFDSDDSVSLEFLVV